MRHNTNRKHHHTPYTNIQHTTRQKNTIFNNGRYTTNIPTNPHTVATTYIKTNMRLYLLSRHLATRGNNKILRTLAALKRYSPASLVATKLRTNKLPFLKSYLHHHYAPSVTLTHTHHVFSCTHICTTLSPLDLWPDPAGVTSLLARWTEKLAGGRQAGRSDSLPPTSKGHGSE